MTGTERARARTLTLCHRCDRPAVKYAILPDRPDRLTPLCLPHAHLHLISQEGTR